MLKSKDTYLLQGADKKRCKNMPATCASSVHGQMRSPSFPVHRNQPAHLMLQRKNTVVCSHKGVLSTTHLHTHTFLQEHGMEGEGPSLALQQVQDNVWKSQAGPAKHSTTSLSVPVKIPPGKLWSKWEHFPGCQKEICSKQKSLLKSQKRTPKTTQVNRHLIFIFSLARITL